MTDLAPPPPGFLVRSTQPARTPGAQPVEMLWQQVTGNQWTGTTAHGYPCTARWDELAAGEFGPLEMLVPVPYNADTPEPGTMAARQALIDGVLSPAAAMMQQLADAAGAGLLAVMADVYQQGRDSAGDDVAVVRTYGDDGPGRPVKLRPTTSPDPGHAAKHGPDGIPVWNPHEWGGGGAYVAICLCGDTFPGANPDAAAEFRADHLAATEHMDQQ